MTQSTFSLRLRPRATPFPTPVSDHGLASRLFVLNHDSDPRLAPLSPLLVPTTNIVVAPSPRSRLRSVPVPVSAPALVGTKSSARLSVRRTVWSPTCPAAFPLPYIVNYGRSILKIATQHLNTNHHPFPVCAVTLPMQSNDTCPPPFNYPSPLYFFLCHSAPISYLSCISIECHLFCLAL